MDLPYDEPTQRTARLNGHERRYAVRLPVASASFLLDLEGNCEIMHRSRKTGPAARARADYHLLCIEGGRLARHVAKGVGAQSTAWWVCSRFGVSNGARGGNCSDLRDLRLLTTQAGGPKRMEPRSAQPIRSGRARDGSHASGIAPVNILCPTSRYVPISPGRPVTVTATWPGPCRPRPRSAARGSRHQYRLAPGLPRRAYGFGVGPLTT